jgi:hypothetical protein
MTYNMVSVVEDVFPIISPGTYFAFDTVVGTVVTEDGD